MDNLKVSDSNDVHGIKGWIDGKHYATEKWVNDKKFATEEWVTGKHYLVSSDLSGYAKKTDIPSHNTKDRPSTSGAGSTTISIEGRTYSFATAGCVDAIRNIADAVKGCWC